jgi:hypothetical protein
MSIQGLEKCTDTRDNQEYKEAAYMAEQDGDEQTILAKGYCI